MQPENLALLLALEKGEEAAHRKALWTSSVAIVAATMVLVALLFSAYHQLAKVKELTRSEKQVLIGLRQQNDSLRPLVENYQTLVAQQTIIPRSDSFPATDSLAAIWRRGREGSTRFTDSLTEWILDRNRMFDRSASPLDLASFRAVLGPLSNYHAEPQQALQPGGTAGIFGSPGFRDAIRSADSAHHSVRHVYLRVIAERDRGYADSVGDYLKARGFEVHGLEYVERAPSLRNTEVRYYKRADAQGAAHLLAVLEEVGEHSTALLYLGLENARVQDGTYEVWLRLRSGNVPVPSRESARPAP